MRKALLLCPLRAPLCWLLVLCGSPSSSHGDIKVVELSFWAWAWRPAANSGGAASLAGGEEEEEEGGKEGVCVSLGSLL